MKGPGRRARSLSVAWPAVLVVAVAIAGCGDSTGSSTGASAETAPSDRVAEQRAEAGDQSVQGFGREASPGELSSAGAVLHGYLDAVAAERWGAACSYLAADAVRYIEKMASPGATCAEKLAAIPRANAAVLREAAEVEIDSLRLEGDRGFLVYRGRDGATYGMALVREDGSWKATTLSAVLLD